jgi:hypothetical protein
MCRASGILHEEEPAAHSMAWKHGCSSIMYTYTYIFIYIYINICVHIHKHKHIHTYAYANAQVRPIQASKTHVCYMYVYTRRQTHIYMHVCWILIKCWRHVATSIYIYICTYTAFSPSAGDMWPVVPYSPPRDSVVLPRRAPERSLQARLTNAHLRCAWIMCMYVCIKLHAGAPHQCACT